MYPAGALDWFVKRRDSPADESFDDIEEATVCDHGGRDGRDGGAGFDADAKRTCTDASSRSSEAEPPAGISCPHFCGAMVFVHHWTPFQTHLNLFVTILTCCGLFCNNRREAVAAMCNCRCERDCTGRCDVGGISHDTQRLS